MHLSLVQYTVAVMLLFLTSSIIAIGNLAINLSRDLSDGVLKVCPGEHISITCTHNNTAAGELTRWVIHGPVSVSLHDSELTSLYLLLQVSTFRFSLLSLVKCWCSR